MAEVKLPQLSETNDESLVVFWHVQEGDHVRKGEPLVEVQTDKATSEIEAETSGTVKEILVKRGESAKAGDTLAIIAETDEAADVADKNEPSDQKHQKDQKTGTRREGRPFIRISPRLRRLAKELGVDLTTVLGTGKDGTITEDDIRQEASRKAGATSTEPPIPLSGVRRTIAERMTASLENSAQLTETTWADVTALSRKKETLDQAITWNDLVLFATVAALKTHPNLNQHIKDDYLIPFNDVHLGVAVDTEDGLFVPVIKQANRLTLAELHDEMVRLTNRAKSKLLTREELSGSTFTVTNLGAFGIQFFTPILNPPEVAILGVGKIEPYVTFSGEVVIQRLRLPLSLTFDHRAIDGAPAARFLQTLVHILENPDQMM